MLKVLLQKKTVLEALDTIGNTRVFLTGFVAGSGAKKIKTIVLYWKNRVGEALSPTRDRKKMTKSATTEHRNNDNV